MTGGARDRPGRTSGSPPASPGSAPRPQAKRHRAQTHAFPGPRLRPPRTVTPPFTGLRPALSGLHPFPSDLALPVRRLRGGGGGRLGTTELAEPPNRPERPEGCGAERPRAAEAHFRRRPAGGSSSGPGEGESMPPARISVGAPHVLFAFGRRSRLPAPASSRLRLCRPRAPRPLHGKRGWRGRLSRARGRLAGRWSSLGRLAGQRWEAGGGVPQIRPRGSLVNFPPVLGLLQGHPCLSCLHNHLSLGPSFSLPHCLSKA